MSDPVSHAQSSRDDVTLYMLAFFANGKSLVIAFELFNFQASNEANPADRSKARAKALEAKQQLDLLNADCTAYLTGAGLVRPPDQATVDAAVSRTETLATLLANQARFNATVTVFANVVAAVGVLNGN